MRRLPTELLWQCEYEEFIDLEWDRCHCSEASLSQIYRTSEELGQNLLYCCYAIIKPIILHKHLCASFHLLLSLLLKSHLYYLCPLLLQVSYFEIYMDKIRDLLDGLSHNTTHTALLATPALVDNASCVRKWLILLCRSSAGHKWIGCSPNGYLHSYPFICWMEFDAVCGPGGSRQMIMMKKKKTGCKFWVICVVKVQKMLLLLLTKCPCVHIKQPI